MTLKYFFISTVVVVDYMAIYHKTLWLKAIDIRHSLAPSFWRSGTQSRLARWVRWAALRVSVGSGRLKVNHDGRNRFHHGFFTQLLAGSLSCPHTWASRLPPWKSSKHFIGLYPERARSKGEQDPRESKEEPYCLLWLSLRSLTWSRPLLYLSIRSRWLKPAHTLKDAFRLHLLKGRILKSLWTYLNHHIYFRLVSSVWLLSGN